MPSRDGRLTPRMSQYDHEIFDIVSALESAEGWDISLPYFLTIYNIFRMSGKGTTFYSFLDVPSTASITEIGKAYRKKSEHFQTAFCS